MRTIKNKFFAPVFFLLFALGFSASVYSQALIPNKFQEYKLKSSLMKREMPYRVILPVNYEANKTEKFPVVYLLHGLTGHYDNWTNQTKLAGYAKNYPYIIVTPEGNDGWYTDSESAANDKYETYIVRELIPEIEKNFRAQTNRESRVIAGLSMGGYGSLKFGLKYPEKFVLVGSFSGALRAAEWTGKELGGNWKALNDSIVATYGEPDSETRRQNDIFKILQSKSVDETKNLPFFYLDCGTEDGLIEQSRDFAKLLSDKKIRHEFRELPGAHNWKFWDAQVLEFLQVSEKYVSASKAKTN